MGDRALIPLESVLRYGMYDAPVDASPSTNSPRWALLTGAAAALGASLCCVVPLVLASLGISGAWLASLTALEPYRGCRCFSLDGGHEGAYRDRHLRSCSHNPRSTRYRGEQCGLSGKGLAQWRLRSF